MPGTYDSPTAILARFMAAHGHSPNDKLHTAVNQLYKTASSGIISEFQHFPLEADCTRKYPGVDPYQKLSYVEMDLSYRVQRVKERMLHTPYGVHSNSFRFMDQLVTALDKPAMSTPLMLDIRDASECIRKNSLALAQCANPGLRDNLGITQEDMEFLKAENEALIHTEQSSLRLTEEALTCAEHILHLTEREPDMEMVGLFCAQSPYLCRSSTVTPPQLPLRDANQEYTSKHLSEPGEPVLKENHIHIEFYPIEHVIMQKMISERVQKDLTIDYGVPTLEALTQENTHIAEEYAQNMAGHVVSALFHEEQTNPRKIFDRGDSIIIGGKTVRELMFRNYMDDPAHKNAANSSPEGFRQYYENNVKQQTNELVAAGLLAGKKVYAYPDNGEGPLNPVEISHSGYSPVQSEPVVVNWFQKLMHKWFGAYKDQISKAAEYQKTKEAELRIEKIREYNHLVSKTPAPGELEHAFFGTPMPQSQRSIMNFGEVSLTPCSQELALSLAAYVQKPEDLNDFKSWPIAPDKLERMQKIGRQVQADLTEKDSQELAQTYLPAVRNSLQILHGTFLGEEHRRGPLLQNSADHLFLCTAAQGISESWSRLESEEIGQPSAMDPQTRKELSAFACRYLRDEPGLQEKMLLSKQAALNLASNLVPSAQVQETLKTAMTGMSYDSCIKQFHTLHLEKQEAEQILQDVKQIAPRNMKAFTENPKLVHSLSETPGLSEQMGHALLDQGLGSIVNTSIQGGKDSAITYEYHMKVNADFDAFLSKNADRQELNAMGSRLHEAQEKAEVTRHQDRMESQAKALRDDMSAGRSMGRGR